MCEKNIKKIYEIDHGVIFFIFWPKYGVIRRNICSWILVGHLGQLMREKKTSIYFGSQITSFESIIDITRKVPS